MVKTVNTDKLRGKIVERRMTISSVAKEIGLNQATLYRRFSENGESFTIGEAEKIATVLRLTPEEVNQIFLPRMSRNVRFGL